MALAPGTNKEAFEAFRTLFLESQARVESAWAEACRDHPIPGENERPVQVTLALMDAQEPALLHRSARLHEVLDRGCTALWQSTYLAQHQDAGALRHATDLLRQEWRRLREEFFRQNTQPPTSAQRKQLEDVHLLENEFWFLAGFAEATAVAHDLTPYQLPKDRSRNRQALVKTLAELQAILPAALSDDMFLSALPEDLVGALQIVARYTPGILDLADRPPGTGDDRIDAAVRDKRGDGYLGARVHDAIHQIIRVCLGTFGCCPKGALQYLIGRLVPADSAVGNRQVEGFILLADDLRNKAGARRKAFITSTTISPNAEQWSRLWVLGQPKPLPRI